MKNKIAIIGAGLAGSEASWQLAKRDFEVTLFEMRPLKKTPAHKTDLFAELVCSNSFKSTENENAHGLLKAELLHFDSIIINSAQRSAIPAGKALSVDREAFSSLVTDSLSTNKNIEIIREEIKDIDKISSDFDKVVICTGPLTAEKLAESIQSKLEEDSLFFYDSIAPVVFTESIDMSKAFKASRYDHGTADYINCPFSKDQYYTFIEALKNAEKVEFKDFEKDKYFEGCLPIEVMAERGEKTLSFGPMKPVGLSNPHSDERPYAVLQLRQENKHATLYNLVGCQTKMKYPEQKRVFQMVPGLENCEFARFGSLHRNTYINAPKHLNPDLSLKQSPNIHFAGQITGVEGYTESTATGLWVALNIAESFKTESLINVNTRTMLGSVINYLMEADPKHFQPMNANFGLLEPLNSTRKLSKKDRKTMYSKRALEEINQIAI